MNVSQESRELFEKLIYKHPTSGCWLWRGQTTANGYTKFFIGSKRYWGDSVAWAIAGRSLGPDEKLVHTCHVNNCVNPDHMQRAGDADLPVVVAPIKVQGQNSRMRSGKDAAESDASERREVFSLVDQVKKLQLDLKAATLEIEKLKSMTQEIEKLKRRLDAFTNLLGKSVTPAYAVNQKES